MLCAKHYSGRSSLNIDSKPMKQVLIIFTCQWGNKDSENKSAFFAKNTHLESSRDGIWPQTFSHWSLSSYSLFCIEPYFIALEDAVFDRLKQARNNACWKNRLLNCIDLFQSKLLQYATTRSQKSEINKKRANDKNIGSEQCHILGGAEIQSDWKKRGGNGSPKRVDSLLPCA